MHRYVILLAFFGWCLPVLSAQPTGMTINWRSEKDTTQVRPQLDSWPVKLLLSDAEGRPIPRARVHLRVMAPASRILMSTDFPIVEGTALVDVTLLVEGGELPLRLVPPIRGKYLFSADAQLVDDPRSFAPVHSEWRPKISENPRKLRNLLLFLAVLCAFGVGSGMLIGYTRPEKLVRVAATLAVISLLGASAGQPTLGMAHDHAAVAPDQTQAVKQLADDGSTLSLAVETAQPRVGQLTALRVELRDSRQQPIPAYFELSFEQLEHGIEVFHTKVLARDGLLQWHGQFYDGSEHRIRVKASPLGQGPAIDVATTIEVAGVQPPVRAIVKSFGLMLGLIACALGIGLWAGLSLRERRENAS